MCSGYDETVWWFVAAFPSRKLTPPSPEIRTYALFSLDSVHKSGSSGLSVFLAAKRPRTVSATWLKTAGFMPTVTNS